MGGDGRMASDDPKPIQLKPVGYKPVRASSIAHLREMADEAEAGRVTAFVFAAIGPDFALWTSKTPMTRQDRLNLMGQLQLLMADLIKDEDESHRP